MFRLAPLKCERAVLYRYLPLLEVFFEMRIKSKLTRVVLDLVTVGNISSS